MICGLRFAVFVLACEAKHIDVYEDTDALSISELNNMVKKLHGLDLAKIETQLNDFLRDIGREDVIMAEFEDAGSQVGKSGRVGSSSKGCLLKEFSLESSQCHPGCRNVLQLPKKTLA